ncbi:MAG: hypothetical protein LBN09_00055 [Clostridioides sp.]|jgi:YbbR domain-containing protein|nr:hypothetical protein [Clostridioides sp.]
MIKNKLKHNTKIKVISLLSAIALWMYVMLAVDPVETRTIENIPIVVSNAEEIEQKGLMVYPNTPLATEIYVTGQLSKLKNLDKNKITIYGEVVSPSQNKRPIEGKNEMHLSTNMPDNVSSTFKSGVVIVNLEKKVSKEKNIIVNVEGDKTDTTSTVKLSQEKVMVSGPRSMVDKVENVVASVNINGRNENFEEKLDLTPVDIYDAKVEDVTLSKSNVTAKVSLLSQKKVPIKFKFVENGGTENDLKDYEISSKDILIKASKDVLNKTESIDTADINLSALVDSDFIDVKLLIPDGVKSDLKSIVISNKGKAEIKKLFTFKPQEIEVRSNSGENSDVKLGGDGNIQVQIEYNSQLGTVEKSDIKLYIDVDDRNLSDDNCTIKYESKLEFKNISISPKIVKIN